MKLSQAEKKPEIPCEKIELMLDKKLVEQLGVMESFTKISKSEIVATALKRFISQHKDYFPDDYSSK